MFDRSESKYLLRQKLRIKNYRIKKTAEIAVPCAILAIIVAASAFLIVRGAFSGAGDAETQTDNAAVTDGETGETATGEPGISETQSVTESGTVSETVAEITDTEIADTESTGTKSTAATETGAVTTAKPPKSTETAAPKIPFIAPIIKGIPYISQKPDFPNGCESVSTVMALRAAGIDITVSRFVSDYLDKGPLMKNGIGPDPSEVYIGDPRKSTGWGCNSPVIEKALKKMDLDGYSFRRTDGMTLEELCRNYVDNGVPVVIWAAISMNSNGIFHKWKTEDGKQISYYSYFHCVLLVGSDDTQYYIYDPLKKGRDGEWTSYKKSKVKKAYDIMGQQGIVIYKNGTPGVPELPESADTEVTVSETADVTETTGTDLTADVTVTSDIDVTVPDTEPLPDETE